jgi:REP element-mobilizing transposase RayT
VEDRRLFCDVLAGVWERFNWAIHACCVMNNHDHLLVETPRGNLSKGMRELNGVYTSGIRWPASTSPRAGDDLA